MEEQANAAQAEEQAQEVEQTDWQAKYEAMRQHSRDWEKRARENEGAAKELEELKAAQLSDQEKANARAEKAERELAAMKEERKRASDAREVAEGKGVPLWMLENLPNRDAMEAFADRYLKEVEPAPVHAAATSAKSRVNKGEGKPPTTAQMFADAIEGF